MIVGRKVSLSGDIKSCSRLVVEGIVKATLHDCRDMEIAEGGLFKGNASIEHGEISGRFEGELVVSRRLLIRASGHVFRHNQLWRDRNRTRRQDLGDFPREWPHVAPRNRTFRRVIVRSS
jgi:hypothetical protein